MRARYEIVKKPDGMMVKTGGRKAGRKAGKAVITPQS